MSQRGGSISRAAPAIQEALRLERQAKRKRRVLAVIGLLTTGMASFMAALYLFDQSALASEQTTLSEPPTLVAEPLPSASALVHMETPDTATDPRKTLEVAKTPQEFINRAKINGVRLSGSRTRAIINGTLYHVGDIVAPEMGLILIGHDPDGEYLLFRDGQKRTVFLRVHTPFESS